MSAVPPNTAKEGLQAAMDVTKYTLAVAGAAIAFLLNAESLKRISTPCPRWAVTLALASFGASAIGGLLVLLQGASELSSGTYNLRNPLMRVPGMINVLALGAGFVFTTLFVALIVWLPEPNPTAAKVGLATLSDSLRH